MEDSATKSERETHPDACSLKWYSSQVYLLFRLCAMLFLLVASSLVAIDVLVDSVENKLLTNIIMTVSCGNWLCET